MINNLISYEEKKPDRIKPVVVSPVHSKKSYFDNEDIKFFTVVEFNRLTDGTLNQFYKMAIMLLYETGARIEEARNIKFADIDSSNGRIRILTLKQRKKSQIFRYLKISDKLLTLILHYRLSNNMQNNDFILAQGSGKIAITKMGFSLMLKKYVKETLGPEYLNRAHPHALRHSRAIHLLDAGMNIKLLQNFLGHSNIINTLIYLKYSNKDLYEAIDRANGK
jgi:integrase